MLEYNLTQRERQIVIRLLELSKHTKEGFTAQLINPDTTGPSGELTRLDFGGADRTLELTKRDLRVLKDEGFIYFRWDVPDRGRGRLSSLAIEAERNNFNASDSGDAAAEAVTAGKRAEVDEASAIEHRFPKSGGELVDLIVKLVDEDEARAAGHDATAIAEQMGKPVFDETVITRKTKGFVGRLSLTFSGTNDLAEKGEMIGEFGERLGAWLVALSVWTDWHAAHHPSPAAPPASPASVPPTAPHARSGEAPPRVDAL